MWWLLLLLVPVAIAKARQNGSSTAATVATPTAAAVITRTDIPMSELVSAGQQWETNVPAANRSTVTDAGENLAVAFHAYSTILRHRLTTVGIGSPPSTFPGSPSFGGGGAGGGGGSLHCPLKGTEIKPLGVLDFHQEEFYSDDWITIHAGEFELTATPSHPVYTDKGIVTLKDLKQGTLVVTINGEREVKSKFSFNTKQIAMNIHVPESHLYYAGGILSHNKA